MNTSSSPYLYERLKQLRLDAFIKILESIKNQDEQKSQLLEENISKMVDEEINSRLERQISRRIKQAQFIRIQTVDRFNFDYNASTRKLKKRFLQLIAQDFITQGIGTIFVGNAGLGKTHLARAIGYAACQKGNAVLFRSCSMLLNQLVAAEATSTLENAVKKLVHPSLLIIDELGYLTMNHQEANLFFQIISRRHDKNHPTVVTSNKPFSEWNQIFHGSATAHAIVDRLAECSEIFYLEGKSYRQANRKTLKKNTE